MEKYIVSIQSVEFITHDVLRIIVQKPLHYNFTPGQATDVTINKPGWKRKKNPFTFTNLPEEDYLEFNIKTYPERKGVTNELLELKPGDELILHEVFGAITYKGQGVFIAGGAGITPFISIFRFLHSKNLLKDNKLIFANKKKEDIIREAEFKELLGENFINILSEERVEGFAHGMINEEFLKSYVSASTKNVYVCGPPAMIDNVMNQLMNIGVERNAITIEDL